ncbi:hypothetical protein [Salinimicrobium sp. GXAS 041]
MTLEFLVDEATYSGFTDISTAISPTLLVTSKTAPQFSFMERMILWHL